MYNITCYVKHSITNNCCNISFPLSEKWSSLFLGFQVDIQHMTKLSGEYFCTYARNLGTFLK